MDRREARRRSRSRRAQTWRSRGTEGGPASFCLLLVATVVAAAGDARAGNLDAFYLAGDAALQAGAITADARGGGALWYNPAGLAFLGGTRLDVTVNGYALRFGGQADFDPPTADSEVARLSRLDLNVVPTALTLTHRFGNVGVGIGAFVPSQATSVLRTRVQTPATSTTDAVDFVYDSYARFQNYHFGAGFGYTPLTDLSLGLSMFVKYQTNLENDNVSLVLGEQANPQVAGSTHQSLDTVQFGLEFVLGGIWHVADDWNVGLSVRTPAFRLGELVQHVETSQIAGGSGALDVSTVFSESLDVGASVISPARINTGLSHEWDEKTRIAVEASLLLPFQDESVGIDIRPTWNVRAGVRRQMGPLWALGGGLFTDRSPKPTPTEFQESQLNFYGATAAVELATIFGIHSKNGKPFEHAKPLVFATSIALSYALGVGTIVRAEVDAPPGGGVSLNPLPADVFAHEFTLHLGTNVME